MVSSLSLVEDSHYAWTSFRGARHIYTYILPAGDGIGAFSVKITEVYPRDADRQINIRARKMDRVRVQASPFSDLDEPELKKDVELYFVLHDTNRSDPEIMKRVGAHVEYVATHYEFYTPEPEEGMESLPRLRKRV